MLIIADFHITILEEVDEELLKARESEVTLIEIIIVVALMVGIRFTPYQT